MRYLCMHKASPKDEAGQLPPPELVEGMGRLIGETARSGAFLAGEGLRPSSARCRLVFQGGRCDVVQGPFAGDHELPQRLVILKVARVDEAVDWARQFGEAVGAARLELGPLTEAWDLGLMPKPADAPMRFMILQQSTAAAERGEAATPAQQQGLRAVLAEMQKAGVLLFTEALLPSASGARVMYRDNVRTRVDGPFTESKELIGGFCMVQMRTIDDVLVWLDRFARILGGTCEVDIRVVAGPDGRVP
ncbi:MAG: hypothetical protein KF830_17675 [Planctomycetes bacterium]|nr:hypothetical protein [Planctomycetota bacterium]